MEEVQNDFLIDGINIQAVKDKFNINSIVFLENR